MLFCVAVYVCAAERCMKMNDSVSGRDTLTTSTLSLLTTTFVRHGRLTNVILKGVCICTSECIIRKTLLSFRMTQNSRHLKDKRSCGLQERRDKLRVLLEKENEEMEVREIIRWVWVCGLHLFQLSQREMKSLSLDKMSVMQAR